MYSMSLRYTITGYCSECGVDFLETDSDNLDELVEGVELRAEQWLVHHNKHSECS